MEASLRNAKLWGADTVLLVPAVVNPETSYKDAWTRSQKVIKERILPLAQELKVVVGIEEVWNKFLLSPLEMARYVDEFDSPWVKAYLDVGNMLFYGFPQDWVRTLGKRIVKVHIKDFKLDRGKGTFAWVEPRRGRPRLGRNAEGAGRGRLRGLGHHRDQRRRRRVPEGRRGALRPVPGRAEAVRGAGLTRAAPRNRVPRGRVLAAPPCGGGAGAAGPPSLASPPVPQAGRTPLGSTSLRTNAWGPPSPRGLTGLRVVLRAGSTACSTGRLRERRQRPAAR